MELADYSCNSFDGIAEAATRTAIADETNAHVGDVSLTKVGCDEDSRRLLEVPSLMLSVEIGVSDAEVGQKVGLSLVAIQKDSATFVKKFKEYVVAKGGQVPARFSAAVPKGAVRYEGHSFQSVFSSLHDCRSVTESSADMRCCLRRSPRAHKRRRPDMKNAFIVNSVGSSEAFNFQVKWELCLQSSTQAWAV